MANAAQGIDSSLSIGFQSAFGAVATVGRKIAILGEDLGGTQNQIENLSFAGDPNSRDTINGRIDAGGSFRMYAGIDSIPFIFKAACGELVTTLTNTHTVKTKTGTLPFVTFEVPFGSPISKYKRTLDGVVDTVAWSVNDEGYLELNIGVVGSGTTMEAAPFDASLDDWSLETPLEHMQIGASAVKVNASNVVGVISKLDFNLSNNVDKGLYGPGGQGKRISIVRGRQSLSGTADFYFSNTTAYDLAVAGTYVDLEVTYTVGAYSVDILIPRVRLGRKDPTANTDRALVYSLPWRASKDGVAATQIVVTTVNSKVNADYL